MKYIRIDIFVLPCTGNGFPLLTHLGSYQVLNEKMDLSQAAYVGESSGNQGFRLCLQN